MELKEVFQVRRSIRKFKDQPVPQEVLDEMFESVRLAPSAGNAQGHIFGILQDKELKEQVAHAAGNQDWIASAPIVFACCADLSWDIADQPQDDFGLIVNKLRFNNDFLDYLCRYPNKKARTTIFENATPLIPAEHIFLTAVSHGLSACFVGYLDIPKINEILRLPDHMTVLYLLPVGYPDETPKVKKRKEISGFVFYDTWKK